jgi:hypothetical protein
MTAMARASSNCKRQTRPLVRESAPHQQTRNCQTTIKIWSLAPEGFLIPRQTGGLTVGRNIRLRLIWAVPYGGGVEYLHRIPASRRRRRKGKSRIWDIKIWPRILRDSDPKMTAMARASKNCKRQTRPLVSESAPHQQTCNCLTVIKIRS